MKKNLVSIGVALIMLLMMSCSGVYGKKGSTDSTGYKDVSVSEAYNMMMTMSELIIVDVSPIYSKGHIKGAINAYVGDGTLDSKLQVWNQDSVYLVYCHSTKASKLGAEKFVEAGFKNVYRLDGNYKAWKKAGYPTEM